MTTEEEDYRAEMTNFPGSLSSALRRMQALKTDAGAGFQIGNALYELVGPGARHKVASEIVRFVDRGLNWLQPPHWMPIETAPKDGTVVLVSDGAGFCAACWDGAWAESSRGTLLPFVPTHWMPSPELPQS